VTEEPGARRRPDDPQPEGGLVVTLWVLAALIFVLQVAWWWSVSIYS
jgi:hypothetical protein